VEHQLRRAALGFRIGAPEATKWASLKEDYRPDAGSVMDRAALDIEYRTLEIERR
jgi:hypothetical protein